ncbi:hypothetical protein ONJ16_25920, partial [Salmonella enterica subsp. enterica serovar Montevideo]|nr:hypothetical protein [Salmonella enterica subsp. enterica serovar Montevideo]
TSPVNVDVKLGVNKFNVDEDSPHIILKTDPDKQALEVLIKAWRPIVGLNDSKKLSEKRRLSLYDEIKEKALSWSLGRAEAHEID